MDEGNVLEDVVGRHAGDAAEDYRPLRLFIQQFQRLGGEQEQKEPSQAKADDDVPVGIQNAHQDLGGNEGHTPDEDSDEGHEMTLKCLVHTISPFREFVISQLYDEEITLVNQKERPRRVSPPWRQNKKTGPAETTRQTCFLGRLKNEKKLS